MENKAIRILSFCLAALFALAVIFFAVGLLVEYRKAPGVMQATLNQFTSDVGVASEYYTPGTQQFSEVLRARIASNKTIAVVTIAQGSDVIFAYPLSSPFIMQGANGQPAITASSSFVNVMGTTLELGDQSYVITSALYSLQPAVIYSYIRISFLVVLAGTLVAGIALMYLYLTEQKKETAQEFNDERMAQKLKDSKIDFPEISPADSLDALTDEGFELPEEFDEAAMDFPPAEETVSPRFSIPEEESLAKPEDFGGQAIADEAETPDVAVDFSELESNDNFVIDEFESFNEDIGLPPVEDKEDLERSVVTQAKFSDISPAQDMAEDAVNSIEGIPSQKQFTIDQALQGYEPPEREAANIHSHVAAINPEEDVQPIEAREGKKDESQSEPAGLFSPATGFGWESYLEERLDSELIRSASSEEDIGLMLIRIRGMDRTDPKNQAVYDQLLEFYKFRDLIFEYGEDGFSCIVHSINVDGALSLAERVYVALSKVLEENGMDNEIGIGISTRSFRLIPGKRIFMEAEQALAHAFEDPETAIVAFRVDPEKYRKYISEYAEEEDTR